MANPIRLISIQVGLPRQLGREGASEVFDRPWTSAIFKQPVTGPVWLGREGLAGDGQADRKHHGGPEKAILASASEHLPYWRQTLDEPELGAGAFGENLLLAGAVEADVCIGDVYTLGSARIVVSQPRQPCWKQARRWRRKDLALLMQRSGKSGWYFRVLSEGDIEAGQTLALIERPHPTCTVARANQVMHGRPIDRAGAGELAGVEALAAGWRRHFERLAGGVAGDSQARLVGPNQ